MAHPRTKAGRGSRWIAAASAAVLAATSVSMVPTTAFADPASPPAAVDKLGAHDRALITRYQRQFMARAANLTATGDMVSYPDTVTLMIAVKPGTTAAAADQIAALGADITGTTPEIGYVKANVPFTAVDKLLALDDVVRVDADELLALEGTSVSSDAAGTGALPAAPSAATPDSNPYMPTNETGSVAFKEEYPGYDGRGVTIGVMDSGIDPTHPALATTTTGERKLVDTTVATNPLNLIDLLFIENTWLLVNTTAASSDRVTGTTAVKQNITWTLPTGCAGTMYLKTRLYSSFHPADTSLIGYQGVAYCGSDSAVWVDTDNDHTFEPAELIKPYRYGQQIGYIGTDNPATRIDERQPFTVDVKQLSSTFTGIDVNTLDEAHGTHVAGITAAHGLLGGAMDGQAPGAKLVSMRACTSRGCSTAALTDGMVDLATNYHVDVINLSIGSSPALNDGQSAMALLYNRLIEQTGVQIVSSIGNSGTGSNTVGDPAVADDVVGVGASVSQQTWWADYGSAVRPGSYVFPFSSRGPREDGGLKPDITAPGAAVSTIPRWIDEPAVASVGYTLPVGYAMLQGTSMASPQATGAAALLLSAAKQNGIDATPAQLRAAIYSSADYNNNEPAIAQGRGQIDVPHAWNYLSKGWTDPESVSISAPVCSALSGSLTTPNTGIGLYNACAPGDGGQAVGESRSYPVTLTRTGGGEGDLSFKLSLIGDDGTFSVPNKITLAKEVPTVVSVTALPSSQGMHSAVLTIDDLQTKVVDGWAMLAVQSAAPLVPGSTWSASGTVQRDGTVVYAVAVPTGATSLTVNLSGLADGSQTRWWAFTPDGVSAEAVAAGTAYCYANYLDGNGCSPTSRTYTAPKAGVWELVVESRRTSPLLTNPYQLTATITR